ncbi:molybdopterin synthase catalytic subunit MoaE [Reinekea marinisedimentorum]|uniref:Molybdopterin synthase catalytic subunit n=1 Tax=Reinekea marinisedimentorum TaxID=230495 RepID=A0A4R3I5V9_9GAMM|nr:molybdopterin synthase catalytic subunit MoaE [Reinekea marinisedimentorum]TCS40177.1 molybdopterin synthase catalytic subunit [Reinekea marinisedimentorum]
MDFINIQNEDFNVQQQYDALSQSNTRDGAVVLFVGRVRDFNEGEQVTEMVLEHYPGMAEKCLEDIVAKARERWDINRVRVIHRVGLLSQSDQIVLVGTSSPHRGSAFAAAEFIMDYLKTDAPFWKKEISDQGERWVEARNSDETQKKRWQ